MDKPKRSDNKYWSGSGNFYQRHYEQDLDEYICELQRRVESASLPGSTEEVPGADAGLKNGVVAYFDYDKKDDTMHIHFGKPQACKTIETGENIYIRKTPKGILSAIEIWNYKKQVGSF